MMRTGLTRTVRPLTSSPLQLTRRWATSSALRRSNGPTAAALSLSKQFKPRSLTAYRPSPVLARSYSAIPGTFRDPKKEEEYASRPIGSPPDTVSVASSAASASASGEQDVQMMAGMRHDVEIIKETFALEEVPKEALNLGLAGVIPYLVTAASTVFCSIEMHHATTSGSGYILDGATAEAILNVLEPLQVGYGAVILSFLGAIHWGLEWAGYGGHQGYRRYAIGVLAPAVAWPTILMPVEHALITQFLAFSFLYSVDSGAASRGWVPEWYATYRFVLTFIVGASIVASLIGRGQISDRIGGVPAPTERILELRRAAQRTALEEGEDEKEEGL